MSGLKRKLMVISAVVLLFHGGLGSGRALGQCPCRGDVIGLSCLDPPYGRISVDLNDIAQVIMALLFYCPYPPFEIPAEYLPCADVADINAQGLVGGDGLVDVGDVQFYVDVMLTLYYPPGDPYMCYDVGCLPASFPARAYPEILVAVNTLPWDRSSEVAGGDEIMVGWAETDPNYWAGGFANFVLNVSRGDFIGLATPQDWQFWDFAGEPDGQGGINIGGGCSTAHGYYAPGVIFTFVFQVPEEAGPAYTIHIRPTQGSWRRVMYDQLPSVHIPVREELCGPDVVVYVDENATGDNDGSSWDDAYNYLRDALGNQCVKSGAQIHVAEGTYRPDESRNDPNGSGNRGATFKLVNKVAIYGGFPSGGGSWEERNPDVYETILSGDLDGNDVQVGLYALANEPSRGENSLHVVTAAGVDHSAILDGFTITGGNANSPDPNQCDGGGVCCISGSPTVANCTVTGNSAKRGGAGIYCEDSDLIVRDCEIVGNAAGATGGGAIACLGSANTPAIINCHITNNRAESFGGGLFSNAAEVKLTNSVMNCNRAVSCGGGIYGEGALTITNCTFAGNDANEYGGGVYSRNGSSTVANCVLWGNTADVNGPQIALTDSDLTISYSNLQGGLEDMYREGASAILRYQHNIDADPKFVHDPNDGGDGWGDDPCTPGIDEGSNDYFGDLHLCCDSPCIDSGDNGAVPADIADLDGDANTVEPTPLDLDGEPRFKDVLNRANTGGSTPPIVDMGAYESDGTIPADFDEDGDVEFHDLSILGLTWHSAFGEDNWNRNCDISIPADNLIGLPDLVVFAEYWLWQCNPPCIDNDRDGYGDPACSCCLYPELDCNDADPNVNPGMAEVCHNGIDDDCDGLADCNDPDWACADQDGDGYGNPTGPCCEPGLDCNDADPNINPAAVEICDGKDNDCSGLTDDIDGDGDGFYDAACGGNDCNDNDPGINPGAAETCDGKDNDCSGIADDIDMDGDGFYDAACDGNDCNDNDPGMYPGAAETCDGKDNDCSGVIDDIDKDGDGFYDAACDGNDCNDNDPGMYPGAAETCDGKDNDCSGIADDIDIDGDGFYDAACEGDDCNDNDPSVYPGAVEICDGKDNDCSGIADDIDADHDGYYDQACNGDDCNDNNPNVNPGAQEICDNGIDDNCDGFADANDPSCQGPECWGWPCFEKGDANGDCLITAEDVLILQAAWPPLPYNPCADFNKDGAITAEDIQVITDHWPPKAGCDPDCTPQ